MNFIKILGLIALPDTKIEKYLNLSLIARFDMVGHHAALFEEHVLELDHAASVPCSSRLVVHHGGRVVRPDDAPSLLLHLE